MGTESTAWKEGRKNSKKTERCAGNRGTRNNFPRKLKSMRVLVQEKGGNQTQYGKKKHINKKKSR